MAEEMRTTTNTAGTIAEAASKADEPKKPKTAAQMMKAVVNNKASMELLKGSLKENAGAFAASLIDLYNTDDALKQCSPTEVFAEALKACSLKLPINKQLGFAYIVPYKESGIMRPHFQIGYKGLLQLAMRTGVYRYLNAGPVYEGEFRGEDRLSGEIDLSGEAESDTVIGYFAFLETRNGFRKTLYWPSEKMRKHIAKFSKSYQKGSSIWRENYDAMCTKTVLRNLLSKWGIMSVEMMGGEMERALTGDADTMPQEEVREPDFVIDAETGEIQPDAAEA